MSDMTLWAVGLFLVPSMIVLIDVYGGLRSRFAKEISAQSSPVGDFEVLVPIWGSIRYLVNIDYLAQYGSKVVLCTTTTESPEFNDAITRVAEENGFRIFWGDVDRSPASRKASARSTSGVIRDRLVRDAHSVLSASYVVCIDADTTTNAPLDELVGQVAVNKYDLVSVRLVPANLGHWLGRLQAHEYRAAMYLRRVMPWLVSGACHAGRRLAHREVMQRHTLFFQGNDVELGIIADALGFRVGHVQFDVPTLVPDSLRDWWRQRYAWSGGEFRLFFANPQIALRHPYLWLYGALITFVATPLRWNAVTHVHWAIVSTLSIYLAMLLLIHWKERDRWLLVMPFYTVLSGLILVPLGAVSYASMVIRHKNAGLIRLGRHGGAHAAHQRKASAVSADAFA
jgi:cellulose synthase/poly-beta-1,6-N-acetylglucosamine synthase-like glycosyltransferase